MVLGLEMVPSALAVTIGSFSTPTGQSNPTVITPGPDGNLWFTETSGNRIGRITPAGNITEFPLPTQASLPSGITTGPDHNLWFTEPGNAKVGRITPTGTITEFVLPSNKTDVFSDITAGPDGALWFIDPAGNGGNGSIGQITTQGVIKEFPLLAKAGRPFGITSGTDGGVWFTLPGVNEIARLNPATGGVSEFGVPTAGSGPRFITTGPDGAMWFTEFSASQIGRINPAGAITEFGVPTKQSGPDGITSGPDGALWFTELQAGKIGQLVLTAGLPLSADVTPAAIINEFTIAAAANPGVTGITTGPDRNLWFTEVGFSAIGRLVPDVQAISADLSISITGPGQIACGTQLSYTVAVTNPATQQTATGVTVNVPTPAATTFSSVAGTGLRLSPPEPGSTGTITATIGSMAPGATVRFQVIVDVLSAPGTTLSLTATVTSTSTDPNTANNTATVTVPVQGGAIVFLSWHQTASTAANPTPPPDSLTVSAAKPVITTGLSDREALEPAVTGPCALTGYNIYKSDSLPVLTTDENRWQANVLPSQAQATLAAAPAGSFYVMTSLWNCGGTVVESGASNTASECGGPEVDHVKVGGKIKIFGSNFTDPLTGPVTSVFVDGFAFTKGPIFIDSTFLKQKGTLNVNGTQTALLDYLSGKTVIVITVQVQTSQSSPPCITSISFNP
jgi:virginiamycin B lyase